MKKRVRYLITAILLLFNFKLSAYITSFPEDLYDYLQNNYEACRVYDFVTDEKSGYYFLNLRLKRDFIYRILAVNIAEPEKSSELFEIYNKEGDPITSLAYNPKNETLYFAVHNGYSNELDIQTEQYSGIYAVTKNSEGLLVKENLRKYMRINDWFFKNTTRFYLKRSAPDYKGFLNYCLSFADPCVNPVFCITDDKGKTLTNLEAAKYIVNSNLIEDFCHETDSLSNFPLYKHLFVADEKGNPTSKSAISYISSDSVFYGRLDFGFNDLFLIVFDGTVYFTMNYGSEKRTLTRKDWSFDWGEVFKIEDSEEGFYITQPAQLTKIHTKLYDMYAYYNNSGYVPPIEISDYGLVFSDIDLKSLWLYDGNKSLHFDDKKALSAYTQKLELEKATLQKQSRYLSPSALIVLILVFITLLLGGTVCILMLRINGFKEAENKIRVKTQQEERRKISYDIHDSIVQDIRAIRIGTEMLEVKKSYEIKKDILIENITNCIVKMRDICYGLSPAELFKPDETGFVDIYTILQTLSEQFFRRTNIQTSISADSSDDDYKGFYFTPDECSNIICIVQEAFKNIEKHSYATAVHIFCSHKIINNKEYMQLFIIDDGRGCKIDEVLLPRNQKNHFGLRMIQERMKMIKGSFVEFCSAPNDGMQIKLSICGGSQKKDEE